MSILNSVHGNKKMKRRIIYQFCLYKFPYFMTFTNSVKSMKLFHKEFTFLSNINQSFLENKNMQMFSTENVNKTER